MAIRIDRKPGSKLTAKELFIGHRDAREPTVSNWLRDIDGDKFVIKPVPESQLEEYFDINENSCVPTKRTSNGKKKDTRQSKSQNEQQKKKHRASKDQKTYSQSQESDTNPEDSPEVDHLAYVANLRKLAATRHRHDPNSMERQNPRSTKTHRHRHNQDAQSTQTHRHRHHRHSSDREDNQKHRRSLDSEPLADSSKRHHNYNAQSSRDLSHHPDSEHSDWNEDEDEDNGLHDESETWTHRHKRARSHLEDE